MIQLTSMSNPRSSALEAAEEITTGKILPSKEGTEPVGDSLSAKHLLVRGKSDTPLQKRFATRSMGALETVIGVDERQRILDTNTAPWRMICALRMSAGGGSAMGTGWLVGPRTIITAGHCVHSTEFFGGWAKEIEITPGRNGDEAPFGRVVSKQFSSVDKWVKDADPDFDIGCIHLSEPIGNTIGWFGLASLPANELEKCLLNISGYPADRGLGTEQYFEANRVLRVTDRRIFYDVDTYGGQSGAPVWIYQDGNTQPLAVGIHAYGVGGTPSIFGITANSAPRIIPEVLAQIQAWIKSDSASHP